MSAATGNQNRKGTGMKKDVKLLEQAKTVNLHLEMRPEVLALIERLQCLSKGLGVAIDHVFALTDDVQHGRREQIENAIICAQNDVDIVAALLLLDHTDA